jgi:ABC-type Na+ efflux pump permease subunit
MNTQIIRAIAQKDIKEILNNRLVLTPALVVPIIFVVIFPLLMVLIPQFDPSQTQKMFQDPQFLNFLAHMPLSMKQAVSGLSPMQMMIVFMAGYMFAPMFLMLPIMVASIFGADSFAGEKERKTLEALLYTPASDLELFLGKTLAALVPAVVLSWVSFIIYAIIVNAAGWPTMQRIWFPLLPWWPMMIWVVPAIATLALGLTVLISAKVNTFMEAYQIGGALVLLVIALMAGQATGLLTLGVGTAIAIGTVIWVVNLALVKIVTRAFSRSELMSRT